MGFGVWGLGFGVWGKGCREEPSEVPMPKVDDYNFASLLEGFGVQGLGVQGFRGLGVQGFRGLEVQKWARM